MKKLIFIVVLSAVTQAGEVIKEIENAPLKNRLNECLHEKEDALRLQCFDEVMSADAGTDSKIIESTIGWQYSDAQDKMGRGSIRMARLSSDNTVSFRFPYSGEQRAELVVRSNSSGNDVLLLLRKGQFVCGSGECSVNVKFDDNAIQKYKATTADNGATNVLFIKNYKQFVRNLKTAKSLLIEASFYQEGQHVFNFSPEGLKE